ncbi:MAG: hypothetical protein JWM27_1588 [Gemmatimonadetes bacterium]|nr:hypothetical protein [Gemmatimonadota bacterium]
MPPTSASDPLRAPPPARIGCAGWSIPRGEQARFAEGGSHLERYASRFGAVEINSSFHRPHRPSTYARWADAVPPSFRFSAKLPKTITHTRRLVDAEPLLDTFLAESARLGGRLACLLAQLPPSLAFDDTVADAFFTALRGRFPGGLACEPRHASWFDGVSGDAADALLAAHRVARVAADPARVPVAGQAGGWSGLAYHRLHGSPRIYYSSYPPESLDALAARIAADRARGAEVWCIFDNTASGAATGNALDLLAQLGETAG